MQESTSINEEVRDSFFANTDTVKLMNFGQMHEKAPVLFGSSKRQSQIIKAQTSRSSSYTQAHIMSLPKPGIHSYIPNLIASITTQDALQDWQPDPTLFSVILLWLVVKRGGLILDVPANGSAKGKGKEKGRDNSEEEGLVEYVCMVCTFLLIGRIGELETNFVDAGRYLWPFDPFPTPRLNLIARTSPISPLPNPTDLPLHG